MAYKQVKTPTPNIPCKPGWCLAYVQTAFHAKWAGATATDGWVRARYKHSDSNFPKADVPVWFAMKGVPAGHVVIRIADGSIYSTSSPTSNKPVHHKDMAALLKYYGGKLTLRGWSEDLNGERVVKKYTAPAVSYTALVNALVRSRPSTAAPLSGSRLKLKGMTFVAVKTVIGSGYIGADGKRQDKWLVSRHGNYSAKGLYKKK